MTQLRVEWRWLLALLIVCVLFIPARIYTLPVTLPFELDPYRLLLLTLILVWGLSLLSDSGLTLRASGLEGPLGLFALAAVGSLVANPDRFAAYQGDVIKQVAILASLLLTMYLTVGVVRDLGTAEAVLRMLVVGGAVVGVLAVIESRVGWTPFARLDQYIPFLQYAGVEGSGTIQRGVHYRAFGSAEHPIALGALLALLAPVAAALAVRARSAFWWFALAALVAGAVSTVSRTAVVMLIVGFALFAALRWDEAKRFVPLALVVMAGIHLMVPGTLGTLRQGLKPSYVTVEQRSSADSAESAGRIADLGPSFQEFQQKPVLGYGIGTRIVVGERANSRLLDNQWLGSLLDVGLVGTAALLWLFARFIGRLARASAGAASHDAVLLAALAASALGYAVGMLLYDAFAFTQVTLVFFMLLAIGSTLVLAPGRVFEPRPDPVVTRPRPKQPRKPRLAWLDVSRAARTERFARARNWAPKRTDTWD